MWHGEKAFSIIQKSLYGQAKEALSERDTASPGTAYWTVSRRKECVRFVKRTDSAFFRWKKWRIIWLPSKSRKWKTRGRECLSRYSISVCRKIFVNIFYFTHCLVPPVSDAQRMRQRVRHSVTLSHCRYYRKLFILLNVVQAPYLFCRADNFVETFFYARLVPDRMLSVHDKLHYLFLLV